MSSKLRFLAVSLVGVLSVSCMSPGAIPGAGPLVIGLVADLSGDNARQGNDVLKGAALRASALKAAGIGTVRIEALDAKGSPAEAVKALGRLARETTACAVIDATFASAGFVLGSAADSLEIPLVSLGADDRVTTPEVSAAGADDPGLLRRWSYLITPTTSQVADAMARYATSRFAVRRYATLFDQGDVQSAIQAWSFARAVRQGRALLVASERFPPDSDDAAAVQRILDARAEAVFLCGSAAQNARAAQDLRRASRTILLLGNELWSDPFRQQAGESADGSWFAAPASPEDEALAGIATPFQAQFGHAPRPAALPGWDAVGLIADAVIRAGSRDRASVREALENTTGYAGALGPISVDPSTHRVDGPPVAIMRIMRGGYVMDEPRFAVDGGSFPRAP